MLLFWVVCGFSFRVLSFVCGFVFHVVFRCFLFQLGFCPHLFVFVILFVSWGSVLVFCLSVLACVCSVAGGDCVLLVGVIG